ncbi:MAG: LuxR C-terminal-related transcriptional regulator [Pseudomonadota bacterium]
MFATNFKGRHPTKFRNNTPFSFKTSYVFRAMHRKDPVTADVRKRSGWTAWSKNYDIRTEAFKHCRRHGLDPKRGFTYFYKNDGVPSLCSIILKKERDFYDLKTDLTLLIDGYSKSLFSQDLKDLNLSETQLHILMRIGYGYQEKQIAHDLRVSIKTIQNHKRNIKERLGVNTFNQVIIEATKAGIYD